MTPLHVVFIPAIFTMGVLFGLVVRSGKSPRSRAMDGWFLILAVALFALVFIATHHLPFLGGPVQLRAQLGGFPLFDQHPAFSAPEVIQRLEAYGPSGRAAYQRFTYTADVIFPVSLLLVLLSLGRFLDRRFLMQGVASKLLYALPLLWFALDMLENTVIFRLILAYKTPSMGAAALGGITVAKFCSLLLSILYPVVKTANTYREAPGRLAPLSREGAQQLTG